LLVAPPVKEMVACVPAVELFNVTRLPEVPAMAKEDVSVVVVDAGNVNVVGETPLASVAKVLAPVIVSVPAPSFDKIQGNDVPPPTNVFAVEAFMLIFPTEEPDVTVKLVGAALLKAVVVAAVQTSVPPLNVSVFVPVAVMNVGVVSVLPARSILPLVNVTEVTASVGLPDRVSVMSDLFTVVVDEVAVAATVTAAEVPELLSNVTTSADVGADAPAVPPVVADQCVVEEPSHVPEPPTQNLLAIFIPLDQLGD